MDKIKAILIVILRLQVWASIMAVYSVYKGNMDWAIFFAVLWAEDRLEYIITGE